MDYMGIDPQVAQQILQDELDGYLSMRFRLTTRLRILNRVGTDEQTRKALTDELEKLEGIIGEYEREISETVEVTGESL